MDLPTNLSEEQLIPEPEVSPQGKKLTQKPAPVMSRRRKWLLFAAGFFWWYLLNYAAWLYFTAGSLREHEGGLPLNMIRFPVNLAVLVVLAI